LAHYQAGRYAEAADWAEKSARRMPRWYFAHFVLAASLVALDRVEDAQKAAAICREHLPDVSLADLGRVPLRNEAKMACLRTRLEAAGFEALP
jgi:tetratricopeptide (TPR) repeat protein